METKTQESVLIGTYFTEGAMGNFGMPGAPIAHFKLTVTPSAHTVSGIVEITQAIPGPDSSIIVKNVKGTIHATGLGEYTQVVAIEGEYYRTLPPPAIGTITERFTANMAIDNNWNGRGNFTYGQHVITDVPVKSEN